MWMGSWYLELEFAGVGLHQDVYDSWQGEELLKLLANKTIMHDEVDEFEWLPEND